MIVLIFNNYKQMNILIISNMYPSKKDPVYGTFVQTFVESINKKNINGKVHTIVIKGRSKNTFYKLFKYIVFYIHILFNLIYHNYDLIYVHTITYTIIPIRIVSFIKELPLIFNVHVGDVLTRGKLAAYLKDMSNPLLKKAKLIVSPSHYFKKILLKEFPYLNNEKIFISPSGGINNSFYNYSTSSNNDIFTIGYVSRIDDAKGWDIFLKAIKTLKDKKYKIKAIIVGRGSQVEDLKLLIKELKLTQFVNYLGPIPYKELPGIYSQFDIFIFPTCLPESLGLVGLEAMASKVPVIGSRIGGLQDYIKENFNGYLFEPGNFDDLSDKIIKFISLSNQEKELMKNYAIETATKYSSENVENRLFQKLINIVNNER